MYVHIYVAKADISTENYIFIGWLKMSAFFPSSNKILPCSAVHTVRHACEISRSTFRETNDDKDLCKYVPFSQFLTVPQPMNQ